MSDLKIERNAFLTKDIKMKKLIFLVALTLGALQADNTVHYDIVDTKEPISKPNHPSTDIY